MEYEVSWVEPNYLNLYMQATSSKSGFNLSNAIEHTYHMEEQMALQEEKMKVTNHRISDLKERVN